MVWLRALVAAGGIAAAVALMPRTRARSARVRAASAVRRLRSADRGRAARVLAWRVPPLAAGAAAAMFAAAGQALALTVVLWAVSSVLMAASEVKRATRLVLGLAGFATLLAGQAQSAASVVTGVARASALVSGPVQDAARVLADGLSDPGLEGAATSFADMVPHPLGRQIADALVIAHAAGGKWRAPLEALGEEADHTAKTLQLVRQRAAGNLNALAMVAAMGVGIIGGSAAMVADMGEWFATPPGQLTLVGSAAAFLLLSSGAAGKVRAEALR